MDATLVAVAVGLVSGLGGFAIAYLANATRLMKRVDELTRKVFELQDKHLECHRENAELRATMRQQGERIKALEIMLATKQQ